ncbi:MAG: YqaJ viral recombinase family protein [Desulfobacteraceae bacterium]|nr:YqaJ viral recombinase family protein [Desulfobacteraceae bacterium]
MRTKQTTSQLEWLETRQHGVGSSDSPILALPKKEVFNKSAVDIYISKKQPVKEDKEDNPNFRRGHTYEALACILAEEKLGMKIYSPQNDDERWNDYQVWHPDHPFLFADFDGLREDGWVVEVKSPMQRIADMIRNTGLKSYYIVQGQHLVEHADKCELPHLGRLPNGCPGVCFVIYECEKVAVQIYEIPRDDLMIESIVANAKYFWTEYVLKDVPPTEAVMPQPIKVKGQKAVYEEVKGDAWMEAARQWLIADEAVSAAESRLGVAKKRIITVMGDAGHEKIITENRHKFAYVQRAGQRRVDMKLLLADNPTIDLEKYKRQYDPYFAFNHYGPKDELKYGDETLDGQLLTLKDELNRFGKMTLDQNVAIEMFDELRERAELYARMLSLELEGIETALTDAHGNLLSKVQGV